MDLILNRYRNLTALVAAILVQLVLLAYQVKSHQEVRLIRVWSVSAVTPLARLLETDSDEVERERLSHARRAAEQAGAVVVLKGDDTLVVEPDGRVAIGRGDSPALATAGTGDVLTGTVAALLAQGLEALTAAAAAVQLHAQAGREAARRQGSAEGVIAGDVIAALPGARRA